MDVTLKRVKDAYEKSGITPTDKIFISGSDGNCRGCVFSALIVGEEHMTGDEWYNVVMNTDPHIKIKEVLGLSHDQVCGVISGFDYGNIYPFGEDDDSEEYKEARAVGALLRKELLNK